jgi:hypothetical protein
MVLVDEETLLNVPTVGKGRRIIYDLGSGVRTRAETLLLR